MRQKKSEVGRNALKTRRNDRNRLKCPFFPKPRDRKKRIENAEQDSLALPRLPCAARGTLACEIGYDGRLFCGFAVNLYFDVVVHAVAGATGAVKPDIAGLYAFCID